LVIAALLTEWSFYKLKIAQNVVEERDSGFPAFRRLDASKWNRWEAYLGTMMTGPLRVIISAFLLASSGFFSWVIRIGHDESKPLIGYRLVLMRAFYWFVCRSIILILPGGVYYETDPTKTDMFDYSYYLGPDYLKTQKLPKKVSTLVVGPH
jgi:hypothetical protein